ncbi:MAG: phosphoribosyltransferase [Elainellaceae cyanobacterium]
MTQSESYRFTNRTEAGRLLASALTTYANRADVVVLALPRGGVPVAFEIARVLNVPMGVCIVRKLGVPGQRELAMGAIASGGVQVLNSDVLDRIDISPEKLNQVIQREQQELSRRENLYHFVQAPVPPNASAETDAPPAADTAAQTHLSLSHQDEEGDRLSFQPSISVKQRVVIVVDDGIATGSTLRAAVLCLQQQQPQRIVVAVPVASPMACHALRHEVDEVVCLMTPSNLSAIGNWYDDFEQVSDDEVCTLLNAISSSYE